VGAVEDLIGYLNVDDELEELRMKLRTDERGSEIVMEKRGLEGVMEEASAPGEDPGGELEESRSDRGESALMITSSD